MNTTSFTIKHKGLAKVLATKIQIIASGTNNLLEIAGIWDTGATGTAITTKVVNDLGLVSTGFAMVSTANGQVPQKTYSIDVVLPNGLKIQGIVATEVPGLSGGCDALIGMDIISLGDFSITNHNGNTCMSLRIPSSHEIDYVKSPNFGIVKLTYAQQKEKEMREKNLKKKNK